MKVWEVRNLSGEATLHLIHQPDPQTVGPEQVLLKMRAASLNYRDGIAVRGAYGPTQRFPFIPFSDGVGEVVAAGDQVTRVQVGDRVAGIFMQTWISGPYRADHAKSALGGAVNGVLAEYVALHQNGVVHVPAHLSDEAAATLPCAGVTAWHALEGLQPGETVLTLGTGGVSLFALQFAQLMGARVISTSSSDRKLERMIQLGASDGINYQTTPNWDEKVWELTHHNGVDRVVEVGGAGTFNRSLRSVCYGGHVSLIGVLTGLKAEVSTATILQKGIRVQGIYVGSRAMFEAMNRAIALHKMQPMIDRVFPFDQVEEAIAYMESGAHFGKICIQF